MSSSRSCARITSSEIAGVNQRSGAGWKNSASGSISLYLRTSTTITTGDSPTWFARCLACLMAAPSEVVRCTNLLSALESPSRRMPSIEAVVVPWKRVLGGSIGHRLKGMFCDTPYSARMRVASSDNCILPCDSYSMSAIMSSRGIPRKSATVRVLAAPSLSKAMFSSTPVCRRRTTTLFSQSLPLMAGL